MKALIRALVIVGVLAGYAFAAELPQPPADAPVISVDPLAQCGANWGIYIKVYDLNPDTKAALQEYGAYEMRDEAPKLEPPVLVAVSNDAGEAKFYLKQGDKVEEVSLDLLRSRFSDPCTLVGQKV